mgnify:CR=1 FL=1
MSGRSKARAALEGSFIWLLVYLVFIHYQVYVNWNSYPDEYFIELVDKDSDENIVPSTESNQTEVEDWLVHFQDIRANGSDLDIEARARQRVDECFSKISSWEDDAAFTSLLSEQSLLSEGGKLMQKFQLGRYLKQYPSLLDMKEKDLKSLLEDTPTQLQEVIDEKEEINWAIISALLFLGNQSEKQKLSESDLQKMLCSASDDSSDPEATLEAGGDSALDNVDFSLYANEEDLEMLMNELKEQLQDRQTDPKEAPLSRNQIQSEITESRKVLKDTFANVAAMIDSTIDDLLAVFEEEDESSGDGGTCVDQEAVFSLVEEGLNALVRRQDIRTALLRKVMELDPSLTSVDDGEFLDTTNQPIETLPKQPKSLTSVNLRHVFDTPFVRNLVRMIDVFLDLISGYNDQLDHYMDHLIETYVNKHDMDSSSLGKVFVSRLLALCGRLDIPVPAPVAKRMSIATQ